MATIGELFASHVVSAFTITNAQSATHHINGEIINSSDDKIAGKSLADAMI